MWALYEAGTLHPASILTGEFDEPEELADVGGVIREIEAARLDEERRQALARRMMRHRAKRLTNHRHRLGCSDPQAVVDINSVEVIFKQLEI